jgi:hypothetical protein
MDADCLEAPGSKGAHVPLSIPTTPDGGSFRAEEMQDVGTMMRDPGHGMRDAKKGDAGTGRTEPTGK